MDGVARDPARIVGRQEGHHRGDVVGLGSPILKLFLSRLDELVGANQKR